MSGLSSSATGWITNFFPYLNGGSYKNERMFNIITKKLNDFEPDLIPNGKSSAPVKYTNLITEEQKDLEFISGFFGIEFKDGFIQPCIGWAIAGKQESKKRGKFDLDDEY